MGRGLRGRGSDAAYGGFNDIRPHSPAMEDFVTGLAWAARWDGFSVGARSGP